MSDLDAAGARSLPDSVSRAATGKLRSIQTAGGLRFGQTEGLYDLFAEVFAQVAAAAPRLEPVTPTPEAKSKPDSESEADLREIRTDKAPRTVKEDGSETSDQPVASVDSSDSGPTVHEPITDSTSKDDNPDPLVETSWQEPSAEDVAAAAEIQSEWTGVDIESLPEIARKVRESTDPSHQPRHRKEGDASEQHQSQGAEQPHQHGNRPRAASTVNPDDSLPQAGNEQAKQVEVGVPAEDGTNGRRRSHSRKISAGAPQGSANSSRSRQAAGEQRQAVEAINQTRLESLNSATDNAGSSAPRSPVRSAQAIVAGVQNTKSIGASQNVASNRSEARSSVQPISAGTNNRVEAKTVRAQSPSRTDTSETISRVKLVQRVSRAFQHLGNDGGSVRLRLAPAELGSVRVEMKIENRKVDARVVAETEAAGAILREHLPDLKARLESFGMQVERIEVETEGFDSRSDLLNEREPQHRDDTRREHRERPDSQRELQPKPGDASARSDGGGSYPLGSVSGGVDLRL